MNDAKALVDFLRKIAPSDCVITFNTDMNSVPFLPGIYARPCEIALADKCFNLQNYWRHDCSCRPIDGIMIRTISCPYHGLPVDKDWTN